MLSLFVKKINLDNNFLLYVVVVVYGIIVLSNMFKNNKFLFCIDRVLLSILSLILFSNIIIEQKYFIYSIVVSFIIVFIYISIFYIYKKLNKKFVLNFSVLSGVIEILFLISLIVLGIKNFITIQILFVGMLDIFYKVIILVLNIYFKKKFSIQ